MTVPTSPLKTRKMKNKDYVTFEQAKALKELGYDEPCRAFYWTADGEFSECDSKVHTNSPNCATMVAAPHVYDAVRWLREVKHWHVEVRINGTRYMFVVELWEMRDNGGYLRLEQNDGHVRLFDDYDTALSAGIDAALELLKGGAQ